MFNSIVNGEYGDYKSYRGLLDKAYFIYDIIERRGIRDVFLRLLNDTESKNNMLTTDWLPNSVCKVAIYLYYNRKKLGKRGMLYMQSVELKLIEEVRLDNLDNRDFIDEETGELSSSSNVFSD